MNFIKDNWIWLLIIFLFGGNFMQYFNPVIKIHDVIKRDTVTVVKTDSTSLINQQAEIEFLQTALKLANGKVIYKDKISQIEIHDTIYSVPNFLAKFDTVFQKGDELRVKYHYPQNRFDIFHKYSNENHVINTIKTVETKKLFDFSHGIIAGAGFGLMTKQPDIFVGYGFKLGLNW